MQEILEIPSHSDLAAHQKVELFPSFGYQNSTDQKWRVQVSGFAFQDGQDSIRRRVFLRLLRRLLGLSEDQLKSSEVFQSRVRGFLYEPQRSVNIVVRVGASQVLTLRRSKRNGHFRGVTSLGPADAPHWSDSDGQGNVDCRVLLPPSDARGTLIGSPIQMLSPRGVSVISDIDDTIKITEVAHRRQLLHNTFLNPFVAVPGMAELYQQWAAAGAAFHYVSSSPWQLYWPLLELFEDCRFPQGSFHLRTIRFGDPSVLRLFTSRRRNKYRVIKSIFRLFPERRFVLVGDSGERDPEIYGAIARRFPAQIERIILRRVEGRRWTRKRVAKALHRVPRELWQTFRVPTQIKPFDVSP